MAKAKSSLMRQLLAAEPMRKGPESWYEKIAESKPALLKEINDVIDEWTPEGSELRRVLPTVTALARQLVPVIGIIRDHKGVMLYIQERQRVAQR